MPDPGWVFLLLAIIAAVLGRRADSRYRQIPHLPPLNPKQELPALSIIIPARDEAVNLRRLLPTLRALDYPGSLEIIVVDDDSSDGTYEAAQASGATTVRLKDLPSGWLGKPHAAYQGADRASGEWLLFIDADTTHHPQGPAAAVAYALAEKLDGLSLFVKHETRGLLAGLPLLAAFAGLFAGMQPGTPLLNGQFILIRRQVYEESRGFAAVRMEPVEDLALGMLLNQLGFKVPILQGEAWAQVHMYPDFRQLWQGFVRLGSGALQWTGGRSLLVALAITLLMMPVVSLTAAVLGQLDGRWAAAAWLIVALGMVPWASRVGQPWHTILAPVGALIVQAAGSWGLVKRLLGRGFLWKDRVIMARDHGAEAGGKIKPSEGSGG